MCALRSARRASARDGSAWSASALGLPASWSAPLPELSELGYAAFDRGLDWRWRRTSYSDITAGSYDAAVASEPEEPVIEDEPAGEGLGTGGGLERDDSPLGRASLLGEMPVGAHVGTLVHRVLAVDRLRGRRSRRRARPRARCVAGPAGRRARRSEALVRAGLRAAIETPLGPLLGRHAAARRAARGPSRRARVRAPARRRRSADRVRSRSP